MQEKLEKNFKNIQKLIEKFPNFTKFTAIGYAIEKSLKKTSYF